jgi:hypothetical protein
MNPEVPNAVAQVIEKAMAPHPDQRYSSAAVMRQALRSVALNAPPSSLHRAQTLTDEPARVNAHTDSRSRSGNRGLPPPPIMSPEAAQPGMAQAAAKPAETQVTDHVIVLLDKVGQSQAGKNGQGRNPQQSKHNGVPAKAAPSSAKAAPSSAKAAPAFQEKAPPAMQVQSKEIRERSLRGKSAGANGRPVNGARPKPPSGKKDVRGKSFFLKKVQVEQEKKSQSAGSSKRNKSKTLPYAFAISVFVTMTAGTVIEAYRKAPALYALVTKFVPPASANPNTGEPSARVEALRYYLEIAPSNNAAGQKTIRATGLGALETGAKFKFHFKPTEGGYLYLIAHENGVPKTFLTSLPAPSSVVASGQDFNFPEGEQWFMIQREVERTPFTVIYSKTQLKAPALFSSAAGHDLSDEEQQELIDWKKRYAAPAQVQIKDGNQPFVSVQSQERAANEPVIFDISGKRQ